MPGRVSTLRRELMNEDLPLPGYAGRWVASRKAAVARAIATGQIDIAGAISRWPDLSRDEVEGWLARWRKGGQADLMAGQLIRVRDQERVA